MRARCAVAAAVFAAVAACGVKGPPRPPAAQVEVRAAAPGDAGAPPGETRP